MSRRVPPQPGASGGGGPTDWFGNRTALGGDDEPDPRTLSELAQMLLRASMGSSATPRLARLKDPADVIASIEATLEVLACRLLFLRRQVSALGQMVAPGAGSGPVAETWSPAPVLGYRVWMMRRGEMRGLRVPWPQPELWATCADRAPEGVPHTGGHCTRNGPGCGIYAVKDVVGLVSRPRPFIRLVDGAVFGLVALSGKVVEHEHGYRAERARVVAAAVLSVGKLSLGADPEWIEAIFARPADAHRSGPGTAGDPARCRDLKGVDDGLVRRLITDYLRDEARRRTDSWT